MGMSRGLEVTLDEPRGRRGNLALAAMFLRDGLLAPVAGLEPAIH